MISLLQALCFELVAKKDCKWTLHYVAGAIAVTDVPSNLLELIKQVRLLLLASQYDYVL